MKELFDIRRIALLGLVLPGLAGANISQAEWQRYADSLTAEPALVRFYTFKSSAAVQPDLAGSSAEMKMTLPAGAALPTAPGRIEGSLAVALDGESFRAPVIAADSNAFSVSIWVNPAGPGVRQSGGRESGMITSSGSGYYDGWRVAVYDMAGLTPSFEIGRGQNSVGVAAKEALCRGRWNHIAATWDGAVMKIYVNGILGGSRDFAGPRQPAKDALAVGHSGYGVGSLRLAVDEIAVFSRSLSAGQVAALSLTAAALPAEIESALNRAAELQQAGQAAEAGRELHKLLAAPQLPPALAAWIRVAALYTAAGAQSAERWIRQCIEIYEDPATPLHLQGKLLASILASCRNATLVLPSRILEMLPAAMELTEEDKFVCAVALARSYAAEQKPEQAFRVFEHLIALSAGESAKHAELRLKFAQSLRSMGRNHEAGEQYQELIRNNKQPVAVRSLAALALAQTRLAEKKYDEAILAYQSLLTIAEVYPHHRFEAESGIRSCENLRAGKAARDPENFRVRPQPLPLPAITFFVAPEGDDSQPGTYKKPFATLARARDAIRAIKKEAEALPAGGVAVYLRGGLYRMAEPFQLGREDSGQCGAPVLYSAWKNERPVFDGGFTVKKFQKVRAPEILARLPAEARGKVYAADLKAGGFTDFERQQGYGYGVNNQTVRSVYADGRFLPVARWPNASRIPMTEILDESTFKVAAERLSRWTAAEDLMADGFWYHLWAGEALHVERVDPAAGTIRLAKKTGRGLKQDRPFYVMNLLEEIDRPGEWYIDRGNGVLYIWLERHPWFTEIVISEKKSLFVEADAVQDLVFKGITFQYGQERAAAFNNCVNLTIDGCRFHGFGGTALQVLNGANAVIYGNRLDTLGHGGMHVTGGNRKNLTSGGIIIENNEVGHFGLNSKTYVPAILLEGVGARVAHNWFHHAPSSAMRIEGNDHLIEYNLGEFLVQESDDQGAIDMWSNASYRGCVMRYNHWRDVGAGDVPCGQGGIRFDDAISGMVVYGNIFERTSNGHFGGVQIHGGQMNIIDNNIFIDCNHAVSFSPWSLERFNKYISEDISAKLYKEVNIELPPYSDRYPSLKALNDKSKHNVNSIWRNIIAGSQAPWYRPPPGTDFCDNQIMETYSRESPFIKNSTFCEIPVSEIGTYR